MGRLSVFIAFIAVVTLAVISLYSFRNTLFLRLAAPYLADYQLTADCADLDFNTAFDVTFNKLCISHNKADATIEDLKVDWVWTSAFSGQITRLELKQVTIKSKSALTGSATDYSAPSETPFALADFHQQMAAISRLSLPLPLTVEQFSYQPFGVNSHYPGTLTVDKNTLNLTLNHPQTGEIITLETTTQGDRLHGELKADLAKLSALLSQHNAKLPEAQNIEGYLSAQFNWQPNDWKSQIAVKGLGWQNELDSLSGEFTGSFNADQQAVKIHFEKARPFLINISDKRFDTLISQFVSSEDTKALLKENQPESIVFEPEGLLTFIPAEQQITLNRLTIKTEQAKLPWQTKLSDIKLSTDLDKVSLAQNTTMQLLVPQLKDFTSEHVAIAAKGLVDKTGEHLSISLLENSFVNLSRLTHKNYRITLMQNNLQGKLFLNKGEPTEIDLAVFTNLTSPEAKDLFAAEQLISRYQIKGTPEQLAVKGSIEADSKPLGQFDIRGDIRKPEIKLSGQDVLVADLMSLQQMPLPTDIAVIDGKLDYQLTGSVEKKSLLDNELNLTLAVKNLSATIGKTWMQDIFYRQSFNIKDQNIHGLPEQDNLNIALVEVAGNLSEIKASVLPQRVQQRFSLGLQNITGKAFDGHFAIDTFHWPSEPDKPSNLTLTELNLAKIIALEKQQGIEVSGKISGLLPLYVADNKVSISDGKLRNVGDGVIRIGDNEGIKALKQQQESLKLAFDALQHLLYHSLISDVTMTDDGQMLLETAIKGYNPELDNDVNFNLNLDYDFAGLLKSLNIATSVEDILIDQFKHKAQTPDEKETP